MQARPHLSNSYSVTQLLYADGVSHSLRQSCRPAPRHSPRTRHTGDWLPPLCCPLVVGPLKQNPDEGWTTCTTRGKSSAEGENTFMSSTVCSSTEDPLRLRTKVTDGAVAFRTTSISVVTMYNIDGTAFNPVEVLTVKVEWHWLLASPQQWRRCCSAVTTTPICA